VQRTPASLPSLAGTVRRREGIGATLTHRNLPAGGPGWVAQLDTLSPTWTAGARHGCPRSGTRPQPFTEGPCSAGGRAVPIPPSGLSPKISSRLAWLLLLGGERGARQR
jgi:hypothetical protein